MGTVHSHNHLREGLRDENVTTQHFDPISVSDMLYVVCAIVFFCLFLIHTMSSSAHLAGCLGFNVELLFFHTDHPPARP